MWALLAFPSGKDSTLAHFSTLEPPVLVDSTGISCLWHLYLQSYQKWAEGVSKIFEGVFPPLTCSLSKQRQLEELFHCSVSRYSHNMVEKNCVRIMWEIHVWAFIVDFYLQTHLQVDGECCFSWVFRASRCVPGQPHGISGCSCSLAILLLPICLEQIYSSLYSSLYILRVTSEKHMLNFA